jgi:hypothetical protein
MASRDLTDSYNNVRSALHRKGFASSASSSSSSAYGDDLLASVSQATVDTSSLTGVPPVYVETVNELQADMNSISSRCA